MSTRSAAGFREYCAGAGGADAASVDPRALERASMARASVSRLSRQLNSQALLSPGCACPRASSSASFGTRCTWSRDACSLESAMISPRRQRGAYLSSRDKTGSNTSTPDRHRIRQEYCLQHCSQFKRTRSCILTCPGSGKNRFLRLQILISGFNLRAATLLAENHL